jgi:hypothetical protein
MFLAPFLPGDMENRCRLLEIVPVGHLAGQLKPAETHASDGNFKHFNRKVGKPLAGCLQEKNCPI